jgi:predicted acetyltransferase
VAALVPTPEERLAAIRSRQGGYLEIELQKAAYSDKSILRNLLELCQHDYSEHNGQEIDEHGLFGYSYLDNYWTEPGRHAFLIRAEGRLAGFALVRSIGAEDGQPIYSMAEFFILRKYRRKGIGRNVAFRLFDQFSGRWQVSQEPGNRPAQAFWREVISAYTGGQYDEFSAGPIQEFST